MENGRDVVALCSGTMIMNSFPLIRLFVTRKRTLRV